MKSTTILTRSWLFPILASAAAVQPVPQELVGVWATDGAVSRGAALFEGHALYLGADGIGAIVSGPPPIGIRITATYNSTSHLIRCDVMEDGRTVKNGVAVYNPAHGTISLGAQTFRRRFTEFTDAMKKALGL